ncbi:MAG: polyribonucleotide nucleotidyltransferase [Clostridia bacterium]|nr:polyribonucleotide nucleotidyltransferase [Clostridia bacterium]
MFKTFTTELAGRTLTIETGKMAQLANGAVLVRYGDTVVISTATASKTPRDGVDFFPLSVDYEEKLYSVGKIPGGFLKREGKPSEKAILTSRVIDRPIRPLFPKDLRNDVAVINTVLSVDQDNSPEIAAMIGTSAAISISDIPFNGPIGGVVLGLVNGEVVINPDAKQREKSDMYVTLAGTKEKVTMVEAGANEVPENVMLNAIIKGHGVIKKICEFIESIVAEVGKPKFTYTSCAVPHDLYEDVEAIGLETMKQAVLAVDKTVRDNAIDALTADIQARLAEKYPDSKALINEAIYKLEKSVVRNYLLKEHKRVDGRALDEIRPLSAEIDVLPRVHGSGLFTRGQTQVLTICTLGQLSEYQILDGIDEEDRKRYIHQYNFPGYSVGEAKSIKSPGRREIGHGALAERALVPVIPSEEEFPYTLRLVSEVLMSNGSTSQGSVCGSTLALMAAGVPIKAPVAGISCGLVTNPDDENDFITFMDIQGIEDFFGDMDFKVAGTEKGITAIQVDIKVQGLSYEVIRQAFELTRKGRMKILNEVILPCIPEPRKQVSKYAPKVFSMQIPTDKIRDVIGSGGKTINKIIDGITGNLTVGEVFEGRVTRLMQFGACVEFLPGQEGLVHISKMAKFRVERVEDVVSEGDIVKVKFIGYDKMGRIDLSMKDV